MSFNDYKISLFIIALLFPVIGKAAEPPRWSRTPEEVAAFESRIDQMTAKKQALCTSMVEGGRDQDRKNRELDVVGLFPWLGIRLGFVQNHDFQKMGVESAKLVMERHKRHVERLREEFYNSVNTPRFSRSGSRASFSSSASTADIRDL